MNDLQNYAFEQYQWVVESRTVLFDYCKTISPSDFLYQNPSFGRGGSIRNLLVHIANTYEFWIAKHGLKKKIVFSEYDSQTSISDVMDLFSLVDDFTYEFITLLGQPEVTEINYEIRDRKASVQPFKLFSHVITHEYHHKGQILSLSRHLGYTPVDTDTIR